MNTHRSQRENRGLAKLGSFIKNLTHYISASYIPEKTHQASKSLPCVKPSAKIKVFHSPIAQDLYWHGNNIIRSSVLADLPLNPLSLGGFKKLEGNQKEQNLDYLKFYFGCGNTLMQKRSIALFLAKKANETKVVFPLSHWKKSEKISLKNKIISAIIQAISYGKGLMSRSLIKKVLPVVCLFTLLFFSCSPSLFAEIVSYESALVWRTDKAGDYELPVIAPKSTYTLNIPIITKGLIKTITATWKSEGDVRLAVSADDGMHFTNVTNGVPLVAEFVAGTDLKWKAVLGEDAKLFEVKIVTTDSSGGVGSFGNPELYGFKYRKGFRVNGIEGKDLFNYQVKIRVGESAGAQAANLYCDGHMLANFNDIRFTLADGETTLPYSLERIEGAKPNRVAEFLVNVPQIPASGISLYLYYSNAIALGASNPKATFDFYEDFSGGTLDTAAWQERLSPGGSVSASKEGLKVDAASITSKAFEFKGGILEAAATAQTGYEARLIIRDPDPASETDIAQVAYASAYSGAEHCLAIGNFVKANDAKPIAANLKYIYRVIAKGEDLAFERFSDSTGEKQAEVIYKDDAGPSRGFVGLKTSGPGRGASLTTFHWIRVRKYMNPEPQVDSAQISKEEDFVSPVFTNTVLAANGDLVLTEGQTTGAYITKGITSPYEIRIIVPSWKGSGVLVDVSTDGGKNYKKDCVNNAYYYSSKGDFVSGDVITCRVNFKKGAASSVSKLEFMAVQYALGSIVILKPDGGESLPVGSKTEISWTAWDYEKSYPLRIEYSIDGGKTFTTIVEETDNDGAYAWSLPADLKLVTTQALVRISDSLDAKTADVSDKMFSIVPADLSAIVPEAEPAVTEEVKAVEPVEAEAPVIEEVKEKRVRAKARPAKAEVKSAQLLCISQATYKQGVNNIGDIVGVFPGDWEFSDAEKKGFTIIKVDGMTRTQMTESLPQLEIGRDEQKKAEFWKDGNKWRELKKRPKYAHTLEGLSSTDVRDLVSKKTAVRNAALAKIKPTLKALEEK